MKKLIMLLGMTLFLTIRVFCQIIEYDIKITYNNDASGVTGNIDIKVTSGKPDYIYYLTTDDPLNGKVIQKSERIKKDHYIFKNVNPGTYLIKIEDSTGMFAGKTVIITEN